jgi:hypothetical protein
MPLKPSKAGLPPWLFFVLIIMIFQIPRAIEMIRANIASDEVIAEQAHVQLAIARIEDPDLRFPIKWETFPYDKEWKAWLGKEKQKSEQHKKILDEWLKNGASSPRPSFERSKFQYQKELDGWTEKQQREEEQRKKNVRECLLNGAAARFRRDGAAAMAEISRAQHIEEQTKILLRKLMEAKKNQLAQYFGELKEDELRDIARRETGLDPVGVDKATLINDLLEVDEDKHKHRSMSQNWARIPGAKQLDSSQLDRVAGENSVGAWQEKIQLIMRWPSALLELGIILLPFVALWDVLFPYFRKRYVERKHSLVEHSGEIPEINEIKEFIGQHMPMLDMRINLLKPGSPFVYPGGYRRPCLAILNDSYKLWRRDRKNAKDILLHELEHVRHGDYILLGYGSLFPKYLKWIVYGTVFIALIYAISGILFSLLSVGFEWKHQIKSIELWGSLAIGLPLSLTSLALSRIITPLFGIWASEFNADYGAIQRGAVLNPGGAGSKQGGIHWWLGGLTHPPMWLRDWLSGKDTWLRDVVRHLIFPGAYFVLLLTLILFGVFAKFAGGGFEAEALVWVLGLARDTFAQWSWRFGEMAALLLAWPFLAPYWERFFAGDSRAYARWDTGRSLAALVLVALGGLAYWVGPSA